MSAAVVSSAQAGVDAYHDMPKKNAKLRNSTTLCDAMKPKGPNPPSSPQPPVTLLIVLDDTKALKFMETAMTIINVVPKIPREPLVIDTTSPMSHGPITDVVDDDAMQHGVDLPRQHRF